MEDIENFDGWNSKKTPQDRGEATLTKREQRINESIVPNKIKEVK
ncbi:MAG: hypothetical protein PHI38_08805 [Sulfurimonas sp.]|nr:hypothetical protein [Sulfurimonas sp.]MDD3476955.1 hypothetical protein [Sulfurimonas sp.]